MINYNYIDFSFIQMNILELLMDLFTEMQNDAEAEEQHPWTKERFMAKMKVCWKEMALVERGKLVKYMKSVNNEN